jgi:acetyltransferase-like isoleucine patch superfamily enzyme
MTTIEAKLDAYLRSGKPDTVEIDDAAARARGIRLHRSYQQRAWVEDHAVAASGLVYKTRPVFVGLHSYMNDGGYIKGATFIGRYCSIGRRVSLGASNHPARGLSTSPATWGTPAVPYSDEDMQRLFGGTARMQPGPTIVGNDVWIGDGAVVLEGVTLGTGCIVAANAVVTGDVDPYAIVAGLPARRVKMRFPQDVITRLLRSRWWNQSPAYLRSLPLSHVIHTLDQLEADAPQPCSFGTFMTSGAAVAAG